MIHGKSQFLILAFILVVGILLFSRLRFTAPPHLTVTSPGDAFLDARSRTDAQMGDRVFQGTSVVTRNDALIMGYDDVRITLQPNVTMRLQDITPERISVLATRGTFFVEPGTSKDVQACTRQVCVQATSPVMVNYVTPGEIVSLRTFGTVNVSYRDAMHILSVGDELVIDELSKSVTQNGEAREW